MALDQSEIRTATLAELGIILTDTIDGAIERREVEAINEAYSGIGQEVLRRVTPDKIRSLMDFHYNKWVDLQSKGTNGSYLQKTELLNSYYELKAMMAAFVEASPKDEND